MRIFVHDYAGHPFGLELSRELARRGHVVRNAYFADDQGPKGAVASQAGDPEGFSIQPITIGLPYSKANLVRRHFLDGVYGAAAGRALAAFRPDVALVANTPLNALGVMQRVAARRAVPFVVWLQDIFGLAAATLLKSRWAGAGQVAALHYRSEEQRILRDADHVVAISEDYLPYLRQAGLDPAKTSVIPNWGPLSAVSPAPKSNPWSVRHGVSDKLVFAYTGTLGLKHNPRFLLALAQSFAGRSDVVVQAACSGVGAEWLMARSQEQALPGLQVLPLAPIEQLGDAYGAADVLVALLDAGAGSFSAPSKVLAYLCAGRPVLLCAPSENIAARMMLEAQSGLVIPPDDEAAFIAAAHALADSPDQRTQMGLAAGRYARATFDIGRITSLFEQSIAAATGA